jgi:glycosyltransferase involved in cell wall biosynthesis
VILLVPYVPVECRPTLPVCPSILGLSASPLTAKHLSSSLRVLHITAPASAGGLESVVRLLARGQRSAGIGVTVVTVVDEDTTDHPFVSALAADGTESAIVRVGARSYLSESRSLRNILARLKPDIVHTHGYRSDIVGGISSLIAGVPRVTTVHGFTGGTIKNRANEWVQVRTYYAFNGVVAVSHAIKQRLKRSGVREDLIHTIPNAIDLRRQVLGRDEARHRLGLSNDEFVIGWVGRMSREKGLDVLIEAMKSMTQPFKVIFIGDGPDRAKLAAQIAGLNIDACVRWTGVIPDAAAIFSAFDLFVLSSRTEGIPIVLLEAMLAGVPIVATRVGGVPEMLDQNEALLIPSDRPKELATAMSAVRADLAAARRRATAALVRLERDFGVDSWVARYDAVYRAVLGRSRRDEQ